MHFYNNLIIYLGAFQNQYVTYLTTSHDYSHSYRFVDSAKISYKAVIFVKIATYKVHLQFCCKRISIAAVSCCNRKLRKIDEPQGIVSNATETNRSKH